MELENIAAIVPARVIRIPQTVSFFNPMISASLPMGIENTALASMKEVTAQFWRMALALKSSLIDGNATLRAALIKEVKLPTNRAIASMTLFGGAVPTWF
jgi:hypothetical protein